VSKESKKENGRKEKNEKKKKKKGKTKPLLLLNIFGLEFQSKDLLLPNSSSFSPSCDHFFARIGQAI